MAGKCNYMVRTRQDEGMGTLLNRFAAEGNKNPVKINRHYASKSTQKRQRKLRNLRRKPKIEQ